MGYHAAISLEACPRFPVPDCPLPEQHSGNSLSGTSHQLSYDYEKDVIELLRLLGQGIDLTWCVPWRTHQFIAHTSNLPRQ